MPGLDSLKNIILEGYKSLNTNSYALSTLGCEGNLAVTYVTPLSTRVESNDLTGKTGDPSSLSGPCVPLPKLHVVSKRMAFLE